MKQLSIAVFCFIATTAAFSQKLMTRSGEVKFEASNSMAFDEIAGTNKTSSCIFDASTGDFVALTLIKGFVFKSPLMEEHFNENYMESTIFPKATFKGKIADFDVSKLSSAKTAYDLVGDLTIHGVTKKVKVKISLSQNAGKVLAAATFMVKAEDYKIDIPSVVKSKFAEDIKITTNFTLEGK
jgi:hypothetical protein